MPGTQSCSTGNLSTVRWCWLAQCSSRRPSTSETDVQQSTMYLGTFSCKQRCIVCSWCALECLANAGRHAVETIDPGRTCHYPKDSACDYRVTSVFIGLHKFVLLLTYLFLQRFTLMTEQWATELVLCVGLAAFGRPLGPPPPERRPPPSNFVERPPFGFDQFGRPVFAPPVCGPPPGWEQRYAWVPFLATSFESVVSR